MQRSVSRHLPCVVEGALIPWLCSTDNHLISTLPTPLPPSGSSTQDSFIERLVVGGTSMNHRPSDVNSDVHYNTEAIPTTMSTDARAMWLAISNTTIADSVDVPPT
jgi:E3 ubiquitin-protein ligase CHFR